MPLTAPPVGTTRRPPRIAGRSPSSARPAPGWSGPRERGDFWGAVREAGGAPIVEPDPEGDADHRVVTFLWRGSDGRAPYSSLPNKIVDPRDLARNLMERVPGTDIWHWSIRMRADWRATYALCVDEGGGPAAERRVLGLAARPSAGRPAELPDPDPALGR